MKTTLYLDKTPLRVLSFIKILLGLAILFISINLIINEIFLGVITFAGPLLGLALLITGFSKPKTKEISVNTATKSIEINRQSLFKSDTREIELTNFSVALKTADGKKESLFPKIRLILLETKKEVEELNSSFFSLNNKKLKRLYEDLKLLENSAGHSEKSPPV